MQNYKLTIEYDGSNYNGWQVQKNSRNTVQGKMEEAAKKIFRKKLRVVGSGRTDSGVHASAQVAHVKVKTKLTEENIKNAFNAHLPEDIVVLEVEKVKSSFHAQHSAKSKTYRYSALNRQERPAIYRKFVAHYPYHLNVRRMREEARSLVGKHNFKSFAASDPSKKDKKTVRVIKRIEIHKMGDFLEIDIEANGFLYKMARNIVGALLFAGSGKLGKGSVKEILKKKDRRKAPKTADARGLRLLEVNY